MAIQVFGTRKCRETQKTERYFKERNIAFHFISLDEKPFSKGELESICKAVKLDDLIDKASKEYNRLNLKFMAFDPFEMILEHPLIIHTPVVRFGKNATFGYQPEVWKSWDTK